MWGCGFIRTLRTKRLVDLQNDYQCLPEQTERTQVIIDVTSFAHDGVNSVKNIVTLVCAVRWQKAATFLQVFQKPRFV